MIIKNSTLINISARRHHSDTRDHQQNNTGELAPKRSNSKASIHPFSYIFANSASYSAPPLVNSNRTFARVMPKMSLLVASVTLSSLLLLGCSHKEEYEDEFASEDSSEQVQAAAESTMSESATETSAEATDSQKKLSIENVSGDSEQSLNSAVSDIQIPGKKLIINVRAQFKVEDVVKSNRAIENLTRQQGGYVALSRISNEEDGTQIFTKGNQDIKLTTYYRQGHMIVRIPREKVSAFLTQIQQQVAFLQAQEFSAEDVTLDIYRKQLEAKLNSEMASELEKQRLQSTNEKQQASNINSITATYSARQQQELARLQQLEIADRVQFSTIELTFSQAANTYKEISQNLDAVIEAEQPSFASQVAEAFKSGWEILKSMVLGIIGLWWLWVLLIGLYVLYRLVRRLHRYLNRAKNIRHAQSRVRKDSQPTAKAVQRDSKVDE